ncbi:transglycosylase SLT domain-containing protein [Thiorhodococcus mannitoliphagus]|uniref:transglycosylase SLT domain-containing protein n=1 Tax=Thiorhodococcus mannitoliphagus TaxID=329406 RepID=UPI001F10FD0C|nr:transglycosylase SLT domain-containing protein [Thiorhodococcus mannitoliphagus]
MKTALLFAAVAVTPVTAVYADVFKYVDGSGNVYFTDTPLKGNRYKLEWHREARKLVRENQQSYIADKTGRRIAARGRVRSSKAEPVSKSMAKRRASVEHLVRANARRYGLSPALLHAVIRAESAYKHTAVSHAGAQGLMQLMPATARRYGVGDSFDPAQNIRGGAAYLRDLLDMFDQDVKLAVAGYNAGEGAVLKYGRSIPPYSETQNYVRKVLKYYGAERPSSFIMTAR